MYSEDRTPTLRMFSGLKNALDETIVGLYLTIPITSLDKNSIINVTRYFGENFSKRIRYPNIYVPVDRYYVNGKVVFYDIGYRLFKDELERMSALPEKEQRMFFDGLFGWLWYHAGRIHDKEMDKILKMYLTQFGMRRFDRNFALTYQRFKELDRIAREAETELDRHKDSKVKVYFTMFTQSTIPTLGKNYLDYRKEGIADIIRME